MGCLVTKVRRCKQGIIGRRTAAGRYTKRHNLPAFVLDHFCSLLERFYLVSVNSYKNVFCNDSSRICRRANNYCVYDNGFTKVILTDLFTQWQTKWDFITFSTYLNLQRKYIKHTCIVSMNKVIYQYTY